MVCTNCGAQIPEHAFACPKCARVMRVREVLESPPALGTVVRYEGLGVPLGTRKEWAQVFLMAAIWTGSSLYFHLFDRELGYRPVGSLSQLARWLFYIDTVLSGVSFGLVVTFRSRAFRNGLLVILVMVVAANVAAHIFLHFVLFP